MQNNISRFTERYFPSQEYLETRALYGFCEEYCGDTIGGAIARRLSIDGGIKTINAFYITDIETIMSIPGIGRSKLPHVKKLKNILDAVADGDLT